MGRAAKSLRRKISKLLGHPRWIHEGETPQKLQRHKVTRYQNPCPSDTDHVLKAKARNCEQLAS